MIVFPIQATYERLKNVDAFHKVLLIQLKDYSKDTYSNVDESTKTVAFQALDILGATGSVSLKSPNGELIYINEIAKNRAGAGCYNETKEGCKIRVVFFNHLLQYLFEDGYSMVTD